jgi:hypothetical protein
MWLFFLAHDTGSVLTDFCTFYAGTNNARLVIFDEEFHVYFQHH